MVLLAELGLSQMDSPTMDSHGLDLPHMDAFFMRRIAFHHDAARRNFDNTVFCDIFCVKITLGETML